MRPIIACLAAAAVSLSASLPAGADRGTGGGGERVSVASVVNAFTDDQLIAGFMATVFGAETVRRGQQDADTLTQVKKFAGPVRVNIINLADVDHSSQVRDFVGVLRASVRGLRISLVNSADRANMVVFLVDRADYRPTIRDTMPKTFDTHFLESNACSAVTGGSREAGLERAFIYIVANEGGRNLRHCMIEEITQSLGPVNDDVNLPHSIFNDDSQISGFGVFDWFILNMLYDPRVKIGMTVEDVAPVLPAVIADARRRLPGVLRERTLQRPQALR